MVQPEIKTLRTRPVCLFSRNRDYFFTLRRLTLKEALPPCLEEVSVCVYVTCGHGTAVVNGLEIELRQGCHCLFDAYHVFELIPDEGTPLELALLVVDYAFLSYLQVQSKTPQEYGDSFYGCPVIALDEAQQREYEIILSRFERENMRRDTEATLIKTGLCGQISLIHINLHYTRKHAFSPPLGWSILLFLTKFTSQHLTAAQVATAFHLSVPAMNRELRRITTYSFAQLLTRTRINVICSLLPLEGFSMRYLCDYIGFSSETAFYHAFRTWRGMTPQQYRETVPTQIWGYGNEGIRDVLWSVANYICTNYRQPISVSTAAKALYLTENAVNHALLRTEVTFQEQLLQHRLHYACALLSTTAMPVCDVAAESGFGAVSTFCRHFKEAFGITAREYRERYGGDANGT